jgi:hypothetical protein
MRIRINSNVKIINGIGINQMYNNQYGKIVYINPIEGHILYTVSINNGTEIIVEEEEIEVV